VSATVARLKLRVQPGALRAEIVGRHGEAWKIHVRAAPEHGAANDAVVDLLAESLSLPRRDVRLVSGHAARVKIVELDGLAPAEAEARLASSARKDVP
jgi:uncharacterized protein (TIGR00251 family)